MIQFKHSPADGRQSRRITVAGVYDGVKQEMRFGYAVTRPGDSFNRRRARQISEGRANKGNKSYAVPVSPEQVPTLNKFFHHQANELINNKLRELELREEAKKHH